MFNISERGIPFQSPFPSIFFFGKLTKNRFAHNVACRLLFALPLLLLSKKENRGVLPHHNFVRKVKKSTTKFLILKIRNPQGFQQQFLHSKNFTVRKDNFTFSKRKLHLTEGQTSFPATTEVYAYELRNFISLCNPDR